MAQAPVRIGEVLGGRLRLVRMLGEGGMGAVYEAVHVAIGARAAVKLLHPQFARDPETIRRFYREARAAAAIGHESIVGVQDVGVTSDGFHYLIMELLPGGSLRERLDAEGRFSVPFAAYIGCQVLSGLASAHHTGIVHRDLKPENIYCVESESPYPPVKLLDFGISRIVGAAAEEEGNTRITKTGIIMGTPEYMSPEQAAGTKNADYRTDLYAVGAIVYELVTGKMPFEGANPAHVLAKIYSEEPTPPGQLFPEIPTAFEKAILKAMAKKKEARYQSAYEMFQALVPYVEERAKGRIPLPKPPEGGAMAAPDAIDGPTVQGTGSMSAADIEGPTEHAPGLGLDVADDATELSGGLGFDDVAGSSDLGLDDGATEFDGGPLIDEPIRDAKPARAEEKRQLSSGTMMLLGLVALVVVAGAAFGLGMVFGGGGAAQPGPPTVGQGSVLTPTPPEKVPQATDAGAAGEAEAAAEPELVAIKLLNVPDGALIYIGDALTARPLSLQKGTEPVQLRVEFEGHEPFEHELVPNEDQSVRVVLRRRRSGGSKTRKSGGGEPRRPPATKKQGGDKAPGYTPNVFIPIATGVSGGSKSRGN